MKIKRSSVFAVMNIFLCINVFSADFLSEDINSIIFELSDSRDQAKQISYIKNKIVRHFAEPKP